MLIGFGHRARQGKNTAAMAVLESCPLGLDVHMYAFADALKKEVRTASAKFGGQFELIQAWQEAGLMPAWVHFEEPKPRSLLQWWGTDYRRKQDPDYWVKRLKKTLEDHKPELALITDVRFQNEADFIHAEAGWSGMPGWLVKCVRLGKPDVSVEEHESEAVLDNYTGWDYVIQAATAEDCRAKAVQIYRGLKV